MQSRGFTLVELIAIMLIVSVLAIAVLPRFANRQMFDRRGFYDQTLSVLRYAQKAAIAQRRNVCVGFTGKSVSLTIASAPGRAAICTTALIGPTGSSAYSVTAKNSVNFTNIGGVAVTPTNFSFNALGEASSGQTFRVSGLAENITIEQGTGYVHP